MATLFKNAAAVLVIFFAINPAVRSDDGDSAGTAQIEFQVPDGAKIAVDGKDLGGERVFKLQIQKLKEIRRLKVIVQFADGGEDERLIDVEPGRRLVVPVPKPGKDKVAVVATQTLSPVSAVAYSRNGRYLAVGLDAGAVVLWDFEVGRPVRTYAGHRLPIQSVKFSPDDRQILTGSLDKTAILWDLQSGKRIQDFKGHDGPVLSVDFSPDGKRILTGSADKTAILWDAASGKEIRTFKGHRKEVFSVAYNPDGATMITGSFDFTATLWDVETGKEKFVLRGHKEEVMSVAFSPDGKQIATGACDDKGMVWETATGKRISTPSKHPADVYTVAFTHDGTRLISGDRNGVVLMFDVATGKLLREYIGHNGDSSGILVNADGRMVITGSRDGTVRLWDMATGLELACLTNDATGKSWAALSPTGFFDGSEAGRHMLGFQLARTAGATADQFFKDYYHPGLLVELYRGKLPFPRKPLADNNLPPTLKIVAPSVRTTAAREINMSVEVADKGGGVSVPVVYVNGARGGVLSKIEKGTDQKTTRFNFAVTLSQGINKILVKTANRDGSWESPPTELEISCSRPAERKSRMYIVAVGTGNGPDKGLSSPARDAQALAGFLQRNAAKLYERVDAISLLDRDASKNTIEDTLHDVADLTQPQDTLVLMLRGQGAVQGDRLLFATHGLSKGTMALDDLGAIMGTAKAMKRVLIVDATVADSESSGLGNTVERIARDQGIYIIAAAKPRDQPRLGTLTQALLERRPLDSRESCRRRRRAGRDRLVRKRAGASRRRARGTAQQSISGVSDSDDGEKMTKAV